MSNPWRGKYPCPNYHCHHDMWSKVSKSKKYWRYVCVCGTELRIPKEIEQNNELS